ncbi:hypothetical protein [Aureibaculum flavum]|uniref:hypothetical protein n=1 Tax=Aureibaculum flavum TaxID=2795986 RepID=UPI0018E7343B|nr:hypothetical protein [Aureibaculum flavum]
MHKITSIISIKLVNFTLLILLITATQIGYAQAEKKIGDIESLKVPSIEEYEQLVFEATQYLLSNPVNEKSAKFVSSSKIVCFWMNQDTGYGIPLGGNFYYKLRNTDNQQYFYAVSIVNYLLDQKINHNRILSCIAIEGETYKHQEDVKEVRLKAAEIFLGFAKKPKNKIKLTVRSKKYLKFYRKGTLNEKFQEELDELPTKKDVASPFITSVRPN